MHYRRGFHLRRISIILLDYSGLVHANINIFLKDIEKGSIKENEDLIRHIVLNSILGIRKKYKRSEYGQLVIALDGRQYWRKDIFPHYKAGRKKAREESKINWDEVFRVINQLSEDLKCVFPYKVVSVDAAEADDIIAVLTDYTQTNELSESGLYPEPQNVLAISEDMDFMQLFKYDNFKLYHPRKKKMAMRLSTLGLLEFTREHVAKAGDDGIPGILCDDDHFVKDVKVRAPSMSAKRLAEFKALGRDACKNDIEKRNWDRNERLIDFKFIPQNIHDDIIEAYKVAPCKSDKGLIFNYLVKHGCRQLLNDIESF